MDSHESWERSLSVTSKACYTDLTLVLCHSGKHTLPYILVQLKPFSNVISAFVFDLYECQWFFRRMFIPVRVTEESRCFPNVNKHCCSGVTSQAEICFCTGRFHMLASIATLPWSLDVIYQMFKKKWNQKTAALHLENKKLQFWIFHSYFMFGQFICVCMQNSFCAQVYL